MAFLSLASLALVDAADQANVVAELLPQPHRVHSGGLLQRPEDGDAGLDQERDEHLGVAVAVQPDVLDARLAKPAVTRW